MSQSPYMEISASLRSRAFKICSYMEIKTALNGHTMKTIDGECGRVFEIK